MSLTNVLVDFCTNGNLSFRMGTRKWLVLWGQEEEEEAERRVHPHSVTG